jgi:hypothetical protein
MALHCVLPVLRGGHEQLCLVALTQCSSLESADVSEESSEPKNMRNTIPA